jgi:A/G-specific adenine glycosylase
MNKMKFPAKEPWFAARLIKWNREKNTREMPWKGEKDPYKIWLSEIILQQTRVEQGLGYYQRFISAFPNITRLAKAPDEKVFKLWEGLGYYSRCHNLLATARFIAKEYKGKFPDSYEAIRSLKGVGPYTAAAISSFAYNLPYAVVDGNVFRVLARVFGKNLPVDSTKGKKYFTALAEQLLDRRRPGIYNQAIMDFGAVVCKPVAPLCTVCIFRKNCMALKENRIGELPVKERKITIRKRWFHYLVLEYKNKLAVRQRTGKDIWQGLFDFPLLETAKETGLKEVLRKAEQNNWLSEKKYELVFASPFLKQQLSHQLINGRFIKIRLHRLPAQYKEWKWVRRDQLSQYAFPRLVNGYLSETAKQANFNGR